MATTKRKSSSSRSSSGRSSAKRSSRGRKSASAKRSSSSRSHRGTKSASTRGRSTSRKSSSRKSSSSSSGTKSSGRRYGKKASKKIGKVMHEFAHGKLKSGGRRPVKSRKQAIAIGISEARREGDKVPSRRSSSRRKAA